MPHGPGNRSATLRVYLHGNTAGRVGQLVEAQTAHFSSALQQSHRMRLACLLSMLHFLHRIPYQHLAGTPALQEV